MNWQDIELTAKDLEFCRSLKMEPDELRAIRFLELTPEEESLLDDIHAALPDGIGEVHSPH